MWILYATLATHLASDHTEVNIILEICRGVPPCLPLGWERVRQHVLQVRDLLLQVSQPLLLDEQCSVCDMMSGMKMLANLEVE